MTTDPLADFTFRRLRNDSLMIISLPNTLSVIVALSRDEVLRSNYRDFDLQSGWLEKN